ncbi:MAG: class IV adenylate cyclase [Anaerolineales bacterium]|nr:class IV adenylate cyclase [Anaerolineales bacterium]MCS7247002.1 class IV adenylate cyclase [Anaerolineales bacterium]MDW8160813.1 class IV adenylate cyclase [Anaerolineales bacterium]MDW8446790.1 class IV adenylate cyclase [Anaerolineales bacterium]
MKDREIEAKFLVADLHSVERKLQEVGAVLLQPRTFEQNLRFDTPDRRLSQSGEVLRLRRDVHNVLTYKGVSVDDRGARSRQEIQTQVSDFEATRRLLEALGFSVIMTYEKYRSEYELNGGKISLDEMPYGHFVEIEAESSERVQELCRFLNLDWNRRVFYSYAELFSLVKDLDKLETDDLSFETFRNWKGNLARLGVLPAEEGTK